MSLSKAERLARARAAVTAAYTHSPADSAPVAGQQPGVSPPLDHALRATMERVRALAAGPPSAAALAGPWWRRWLRRCLSRLLRVETYWQHEANLAILENLEQVVAGLEAQKQATATLNRAQAESQEQLQAADGVLHAQQQVLTLHGEAQDRLERQLEVMQQQAAEAREAARRLAAAVASGEARLRDGQARLARDIEKGRNRASEALRQSEHVRRSLVAAAQRLLAVEQGMAEMHQQLAEQLPPLVAAAGLAGDDVDTPAFMERFRGSEDTIRERLRPHVQRLAGAGLPGPVLDVGCGRGELLQLCREQGIPAEGVETDERLVAAVRSQGLKVVHADGLAHLRSRPEASLGAVFSAQVIEHLPAAFTTALIREAHRVLAANGLLILETLNPASLAMHANTFYRDPSHRRPLHPDTAAFLLESSGFVDVSVTLQAPVPAEYRLAELGPGPQPELRHAVNRNLRILDDLLFAPFEYFVQGRRP